MLVLAGPPLKEILHGPPPEILVKSESESNSDIPTQVQSINHSLPKQGRSLPDFMFVTKLQILVISYNSVGQNYPSVYH